MAPVVFWVGYAVTQTVVGAFVFKTIAALAIASISRSLFKPKIPSGGGAAAVMSRDRTITVRESAAVRRIVYGDVRLGGAMVYIETTGSNKYLHVVVAYAGHEIEEYTTHYLDGFALTLDEHACTAPPKYAGKVWVYEHMGTDSQAADAWLAAASTYWNAAHRLRGIAYTYYKFEYNEDSFSGGIPNITARIKGKKVRDPRTDTTAYSNNAALCAADYLVDDRLGLGVDVGAIDDAVLATAANTCDENVALAAGGTEDRYTCNGAIETDATPREIIQSMASAKAAPTLYAMGKWYVYAGEYRTPTVTITAADLRAPVDITARLPRRELINSVKGVYLSAENKWQLSDFPVVKAASWIAEDNAVLWRDVQLPFTTSAARAQRIAKIEIGRSRRQITVQCRCKLMALAIMPGDTVMLTLDRLGWAAKVFEVTDWNLAQDDDLSLGVDLTLRETDANVYEWNLGDESTALPADTTNLPDPWTVEAPTGIYATTGVALTGAGDTTYKVGIGWTSPSDQFVLSGGQIQIEYKESTETKWRPSWFVSGATDLTEIYQLKPDTNYDVRIRAYNGIAYSAWVSLYGFTVVGGGAVDFNDYGFFYQAVTSHKDYGLFSDPATVFVDYGSMT